MMPDGRRRLLLTADAVGGVWTYALDLAVGLAAHGIVCELALLGQPPARDQLLRAASVPGLSLHETGLPLDWLARNSTEVLAAGLEIAVLAENVDADLIQLHAPALAAHGMFPVPAVVVSHSCVKTWWHSQREGGVPANLVWHSHLAESGYQAANCIVAPTHAFADLTRRCYALSHAPAVVHNGRCVRKQSLQPAQSDIIFTAGRLWDPAKNLAALDRVAAQLRWKVVAAGATEGPNGAHIQLPNIHTLGQLDEMQMAQQLARRPVFISLAVYEPFGLSVLEAAQAGCALILADQPTFRELWSDAAMFVPPGDDAATVAAINQVMCDPAQREELGRTAALRAGAYSVAAMAGGMARIYAQCLEPRQAVIATA